MITPYISLFLYNFDARISSSEPREAVNRHVGGLSDGRAFISRSTVFKDFDQL